MIDPPRTLRPTALPEAREGTVRYTLDNAEGYARMQSELGVLGKPATVEQGAQWVKAELARWRMADLFHVSADMARLARGAADSMPDFEFHRDDLPSEFGFMYFEDPIGLSGDLISTGRAAVVGCLWGPMTMSLRQRGGEPGVWMSFYTLHPSANRLVYDNEAWLGYGHQSELSGDRDGWPAAWAYVVRCSWLLMQQSISSENPLRPDRASCRRLGRIGGALSTVRVITLRHARQDHPSADPSSREFHHQWIVRGHWRRQWYASQDRHVPIWISPHVKGPDGAPLLGGEKVYAWKR